MLLRGNRVSLVADDDETTFDLPDHFWMVWDKSGRILRRCDVFILPCKQVSSRNVEFDPSDVAEAEDYWGPRDRWVAWQFDLPKGPWKKVARLARIGYRRGRTGNWMHPGPSEAPLEQPVTLYESPGVGYRIRMPDGCVLDDRGFIFP